MISYTSVIPTTICVIVTQILSGTMEMALAGSGAGSGGGGMSESTIYVAIANHIHANYVYVKALPRMFYAI